MSAEPSLILATDCGSTTTKAILIARGPDGYRLVARGEAPTTVEAPHEDVTRGILDAAREIEAATGRTLVEGGRILTPRRGDAGVDLFLSTSSAGGGLQMLVAGVVASMTAQSAERAALGAGAIVMDVVATNDARPHHETIRRIRALRPDMILLSGGVDGGTTAHVAELAELIAAADPEARLGAGYELPIVYAGNADARAIVAERLGGRAALTVVDNLRPVLEREDLRPARSAIHDLFLTHVMAHAPGYRKLLDWTSEPVIPTPAAVGAMVVRAASRAGADVIAIDIGGATTDIFSVLGGVFHRTVSANLGMSYSVSNVLAEAGAGAILRWIPEAIDEQDLRDRVRNKMVRPTTIPQTAADLRIEHAIAREAIRLAFDQHAGLAVGLKGIQSKRTISDTFEQSETGRSLVDLHRVGLVIGSGGVLSHAPRRVQAAMVMIDALLPCGITRLAVDSIFMMPQLGALAARHEEAAWAVFERDCLVPLGACVAPSGHGRAGKEAVRIVGTSPRGPIDRAVPFGTIERIPLGAGETARLRFEPAKGLDLGAGPGTAVEAQLAGGEVGILVDARGRPLVLPDDPIKRRERLAAWAAALDLYPPSPGGRHE